MAETWVCDTCLVPNDVADNACSCCGTFRLKTGIFGVESGAPGDQLAPAQTHLAKVEHHMPPTFLKPKEMKPEPHHDDKGRVRQTYSPLDLRHTTLFVVGSSEVDQLPKGCCDQAVKPGTHELQPLYEVSLPFPLLTLPKVRVNLVACGALHTAFVTSTGAVYTFGCNDMGALGRPPNTDPNMGPVDSEPTLVDLRSPVKKASCGDNHTLFLTYTGQVFLCGGFKDSDGPIGVANYRKYDKMTKVDHFTEPAKVPCEVEGSTVIADIASGENHCVLLCQGGRSMYTFGSNEFSQLLIWDDSQIQNNTEEDVKLEDPAAKKLLLTWPQHRTLADVLRHGEAKEGAEAEETGSRTRTRKRARTNEDLINQVFTGNCTTFFQTKSLRLYGAGRNAQGEVGVGSEELVVKKPVELTFFRGVELTSLSGGQFFTMALANRYLFTWGKLEYLGIDPQSLNGRTSEAVHEEFVEEYQDESTSEEGDYPGVKRRRMEHSGKELDSLDAMARVLAVDYEKKRRLALKAGKATTPVLVHLDEAVELAFHGPDSLFVVSTTANVYAWGSAQNYILGNGKDTFYQKEPEMVPPEHLGHCKVIHGAGGSQHTVFLTVKKRTAHSFY